MRKRAYRVFVCSRPSDYLQADGWKDVKADNPTDAALRAGRASIRQTGFAWVYVGIGGNRHPNGIPMCVRGFELRGWGSRHVDGEGRPQR